MRKITFIICVLLLTSFFDSKAQEIQFNQSALDEMFLIAKKENKLIYIDFYTVWCGPCKAMAKNVFTNPDVAAFYNDKFLCYKIDAENEGKQLARKYNINAYPSSVFVNANGEMVYKKTGSLDVEKFIQIGKDALLMLNDSNSFAELKKIYPQKSNDEFFLKTYINKMIQYGESPIEAIEDYLKVQTSFKENEVEMMEFLMNHSKYLICGGKAESVLKTNFKEFFDIATRNEEKALNVMEAKMIRQTRYYAIQTNNAELFKLFIDRWIDENQKRTKEDLNDFQLEYLYLKKDDNKYKEFAAHYMDSIVAAKSIEQIRMDDQKKYDDYVKKENGQYTLVGESVKKAMKVFEAEWQLESLLKAGQIYLNMSTEKSEFKKLIAWSDYGMLLLPEDYRMTNFKSKIYQKSGDKKKALQYKKMAFDMMAPTHKEYKKMQLELTEMESKK